MGIKYYNKDCEVDYPVGDNYGNTTYFYVKEVANIINKTYPTSNIILVVRGTSGTIIAGGVAYLLSRRVRQVDIAISRKSTESSHSYGTLTNIDSLTTGIFIVVDDFICSGETIENILNDLKEETGRDSFDMLCISNHYNSDLKSDRSINEKILSLFDKFDYVCCNKRGFK